MSRRQINLEERGIEVRLGGLTAAAALRGRLFIPYDAIVGVSAGSFDPPRTMWRALGTAFGSHLHGLFRDRGRWVFVSVDDLRRVLRLDLDPTGLGRPRYSTVVLGIDDPGGARDAIEARITSRSTT